MNGLSNINLRHIRAFVAVARLGSFTRAADRLAVSQPALTISVRQLEENIGLTLFHRTTRRVILTEAGTEFFATAERLLSDFQAALADMQALVDIQRGHVGVAALPSVALEWLPPAVAHFAKDHPGIRIDIASDNSHGTYRRVGRREVDFGFTGQALYDAEVSHQKLLSQPIELVCHADHPLARLQGPVKWLDLKDNVFINAGNDDSIRTVIENVPALSETLLDTQYRTNKAEIVAAMVQEGIGVTAVASAVLPPDVRRKLTIRELHEPAVTRSIYVIRLRGRVLSPAAKQFLKVVLKTMRATPEVG